MGAAVPPGPQRPHPARNSPWPAGRRAEPPDGAVLDLVALVTAVKSEKPDGDLAGLSSEDRRILGSCREPVTVAEVAAATALPVSVVRVRLAGLIRRGRVRLQPQPPGGEQPGPGLLNVVLDGLRTL